MQMTLPVPISIFNSFISSNFSGSATGSIAEKFLIAVLPGDAAYFISMGLMVPF